MIINTGVRTDVVQYFTPWLLNRIGAGFVYSRNPLFPDKILKYDLTPDKVDCLVNCSKNYQPLLLYVKDIMSIYNTYYHYTITAYGTDVEPRVPSIDESIETLIKLSEIAGKQRIAWRYDPVLLTEKYTVDYHFKTFEYMCKRLYKYIDRCIFSFVEMYKKLEKNMPEIILLTDNDKLRLAEGLGQIANRYGIFLQTCACKEEYKQFGIHESGCLTLDILGRANNITFKKMRHAGMRENCRCIENRGLGDYETCINGCKYCYANKDHQKALLNYRKHNPESPLLLGEVGPDDIIIDGNQPSFLITEQPYTPSLF